MAPGTTAFVTGANGHVGRNLVHALVQRGYRVRASVRDARDPGKVRGLPVDRIELVSLDVRDAERFAQLAQGAQVLFHVAATYKNYTRTAREAEEMVSDSLDGARAAVFAAARHRARLVFTSSVVAIPLVPRGGPPTTEAEWRTDFTLPYHRAKTVAEQHMWRLAREHGVDTVAVLPGAILGPGFRRSTASTDVIESFRLGGLKNGTPNANFPAVDVRDVIDGHILAAESGAGGRFILCNDHLPTLRELGRIAHAIDPAIPPPGPMLPDIALGLGPFFDWMNHRTSGAPRTIGAEFVAAVRGKEWTMSNARAARELGWRPRVPLEQSVADTLATLKELREPAHA